MKELLEHIKLEYWLQSKDIDKQKKQWIFESQGLPKQLDGMLSAIVSDENISYFWKKLTGHHFVRFKADMYSICKDVPGNFLGPGSYLRIGIQDPFAENPKPEGGSYEGARTAEFNRETGLLDKASINLTITIGSGASLDAFQKALRHTIGHELIHAFEDYNRQCTGADSLGQALADRGYGEELSSDEVNDKILQYAVYMLDPAEQKAWIGCALLDIETYLKDAVKAGKLKDVRNVDRFLRLSPFWMNYEVVRDWIEYYPWDRIPKWRQEKLLQHYNQLVSGTGRAPTTYNQLKKKIFHRWYEFNNKFKTKVGQMVGKCLADLNV